MENLENALFLDQIPLVWTNRAYPSLLGLGAWFSDLLLRIRELETWTTDFVVSIRNCIYLLLCNLKRNIVVYFLHIQKLFNLLLN